MIFSEVIEQILFERGIDHKELATELGISAPQVRNLHLGITKMPSDRVCNKIVQYCKKYDVDIDINWNDILYDIFISSESFRGYSWIRDMDEDGYVVVKHKECGRKTYVPKDAFGNKSVPCIHCWVDRYLIDNKNQKIIQVIDRTITEAIIPNGVQEIGRMVFDYCEHLEKVYMPNSLTTIRSAAFQMCEALADVKLSNNLKTIENGAFTGTKMLIDIVIPASVTNFGEHIFIMEEQPKRIFCEHYSWQLPQDINWTGCKGTIYAKGTWHYDNGRPVPNN